MVAHILPNTDEVHKITVIPRGRALGYTLTLPEQDKFLMTREQLRDELAMLMGGRVAEEIVAGDVTTGAAERHRAGDEGRAADGDRVRHVGHDRSADARAEAGRGVPRPRLGLHTRLLGRRRVRDRPGGAPADRRGARRGARHPDREPRRSSTRSRPCCWRRRRSIAKRSSSSSATSRSARLARPRSAAPVSACPGRARRSADVARRAPERSATPASPRLAADPRPLRTIRGCAGPLGHVRLLRNPHRLAGRHPRHPRRPVAGRRRGSSRRPVPPDRADRAGRPRHPVPEGDGGVARAAGRRRRARHPAGT